MGVPGAATAARSGRKRSSSVPCAGASGNRTASKGRGNRSSQSNRRSNSRSRCGRLGPSASGPSAAVRSADVRYLTEQRDSFQPFSAEARSKCKVSNPQLEERRAALENPQRQIRRARSSMPFANRAGESRMASVTSNAAAAIAPKEELPVAAQIVDDASSPSVQDCTKNTFAELPVGRWVGGNKVVNQRRSTSASALNGDRDNGSITLSFPMAATPAQEDNISFVIAGSSLAPVGIGGASEYTKSFPSRTPDEYVEAKGVNLQPFERKAALERIWQKYAGKRAGVNTGDGTTASSSTNLAQLREAKAGSLTDETDHRPGVGSSDKGLDQIRAGILSQKSISFAELMHASAQAEQVVMQRRRQRHNNSGSVGRHRRASSAKGRAPACDSVTTRTHSDRACVDIRAAGRHPRST